MTLTIADVDIVEQEQSAGEASGSDALWERELGDLLNDLTAAQGELLALLAQKQKLLVRTDVAGLESLADQERALLDRLQRCHDRRQELLRQAAEHQLPNNNLRSLAQSAPPSQRPQLRQQVKSASAQARLLQHHSLTTWVLAQRTLLHLAQMLELIATGGRRQPTYSKEPATFATGTLVDQQA